MQALRQTIPLHASASHAFEFTINPSNTPKWVESVVAEQTSETPIRLGTTYRNQDKDGEWREFKVTALEPGVMFEMTKTDDNHHVRYTFIPVDSTHCELEYYITADGEELRGAFNQTNVQRILQKLGQVVEQEYCSNFHHCGEPI